MFGFGIRRGSANDRRHGEKALRFSVAGLLALALAGCANIIPRAPEQAPAPRPIPEDTGPRADALPDEDTDRHRIALLVPLSGANASVGQSIANATTMALIDTNTSAIRITTYDTATGARDAASRAIADGNRLILGPLLGDEVDPVVAAARPDDVPLISFSNNSEIAGDGVFVMGQIPAQSVARTIDFARTQGITDFAALVPTGEYGRRVSAALMDAARVSGGRVTAIETYDRSESSLSAAAKRLEQRDPAQAVMIADSSRMVLSAAPLINAGNPDARLLGTELWSGESAIARSPALRGAWFAAIPDARFGQFASAYQTRFGSRPHRIATLGYDAVLLVIRISRDWAPGRPFPTRKLYDESGFLGLDGAFRFGQDGVIERMFEVREVTSDGVTVVSPAPDRFEG